MTDNGRASTGDRRVRRTRASLQRALIELVAEQDLSEIGVADVVDRADVSRSTFYDHYRDVHELAEAACASMIDDLLASLTTVDPAPAKPSDPREDPSLALTAFFTHFAEHAALYRSEERRVGKECRRPRLAPGFSTTLESHLFHQPRGVPRARAYL